MRPLVLVLGWQKFVMLNCLFFKAGLQLAASLRLDARQFMIYKLKSNRVLLICKINIAIYNPDYCTCYNLVTVPRTIFVTLPTCSQFHDVPTC